MLRFGKPPYQDVHLALIVGKICCHLLAKNHSGQVRNLQAAGDGVVIGDGYEVHADVAQTIIQLKRVRITGRKFKAAEHPVGSARAVTGMNMQIGFRLRRIHCSERKRASHSS